MSLRYVDFVSIVIFVYVGLNYNLIKYNIYIKYVDFTLSVTFAYVAFY